jgi:hypothetical protein
MRYSCAVASCLLPPLRRRAIRARLKEREHSQADGRSNASPQAAMSFCHSFVPLFLPFFERDFRLKKKKQMPFVAGRGAWPSALSRPRV